MTQIFWVRPRTHPQPPWVQTRRTQTPTCFGQDTDLTSNPLGSGLEPQPKPFWVRTRKDPNPNPLESEDRPIPQPPWGKTRTPPPTPLGLDTAPPPTFGPVMDPNPNLLGSRQGPQGPDTTQPQPPTPLGLNAILLGQTSRPAIMDLDEGLKSIGSRGRTQC